MSPKLFLMNGLALLAVCSPAFSQDVSEIPPPKAPLVAPVPENADWTVTIKYPTASAQPGAAGQADRRMAEVHSTKTGKLKRDVIAYASGPAEEHWYADTLFLWTNPQGGVAVNDLTGGIATESTDPSPSVATGFPGMGWLRIEDFDKVVLVEKRPAYHFAHDGREAWVDVETKRPVMYKSGDLLFRYQFNAPPTSALALPPEFQKAADFCQAAKERRKQVAKELERHH